MSVLLCHYGSGLKTHTNFASVLNYGKFGVHVFFLISGYVIILSLLNHNYHPKDFFRFLLKRSARIEVVYIVTILLTLLSFWIFRLFPFYQGEVLPFIPGQFLAHIFYLIPFTKWEYYNSVFWTLGIEFQFYLLIGCLYFIRNNMWFRVSFLILFSLTAFIPFKNSAYLLTTYAPIFALGIAAMHFQQSKSKWYLMVMLFCAIMIYSFDGPLVLALLGASILVIYLFNYKVAVFNFLGKISYSLYLIHSLVLIYTVGITKKIVPNYSDYELPFFFFSIAMAIAVAYLFYLLVEKPSIALSKKIVYNKR